MPTAAVPYYHFTVNLDIADNEEIFIHDITVNKVKERNYLLADKNDPIPQNQPRNRRRLTIAEALKSVRPDRFFTKPTLYGRADWQRGGNVTVHVTLSLGGKEGERYAGETSATAPGTGGYWNPAWRALPERRAERDRGSGTHQRAGPGNHAGLPRHPDGPAPRNPGRALRPRAKEHREVPSQVIDYSRSFAEELPMYDEHGKQKPATFLPTDALTVAFSADVDAHGTAVYLLFHGNPDAPAPGYVSDLTVTGDAPGQTVENSTYRFQLHPLSGMLDEVTLKSKPEFTFVHKKETNGAIQWNPGAYAPPRAWVHVSDWEPDKFGYEYEEVQGPVVFRTRRWGQMPQMPEITSSMEYEFYAGAPYFLMRSTLHVRHEVAVQALRNAEVVFAREAFSEAAWYDEEHGRVETRHIVSQPDLTEWTMADTTPWVAFFDREKGCGYGGIQVNYMNGGLNGAVRTLNPYIYITTGPWIYWTRALAYPYGGRNPQQLVNIPEGSVFLEEWAYVPFELGKSERSRFDTVSAWHERLANPLVVHLEAPIDPRMEIPEEIYIEPAKTGWGDDAGYHKE